MLERDAGTKEGEGVKAKTEKPLTGKQEKFCQCIADGMTQADAYRTAYNAGKMKPESVQVNASKLMADANIALRVAELRGALAKKALWTREKSVAGLVKAFRVAEDAGNAAAMTGSIKELNAMHGYNAPSKVDLLSSDGTMTPKAEMTDEQMRVKLEKFGIAVKP